MKKLFVSILFVSVFFVNLFAQDTIYCKPDIKEVTIYNSKEDRYDRTEKAGGSQINLEGVVNLKVGTNTIIFTNLPEFISFQIDCDNSIEIISSGKRQKILLDEKQKSKQIADLTKKQEEIEKELDKIKSRISIYSSEREMILSNKTLSTTNTPDIVEAIRKLGDFYRLRLEDIDAKRFDENRNSKLKNDELAKITAQIAAINADNGETSYELVALVSSTKAEKAKFLLSIYERTATWTAEYDLKVKNVKSPFDLHYKANITQQTGQDWKNVKVNLSSSQPKLGAECPEIWKWNLDYFAPYYALEMKMLEDVETGQLVEKKVKQDGAEVFVDKTINFNYLLPQLMNIPSSNNPQNIEITTYQIPAIYKYVCIPKIDPDVFLTAEVTNWEKFNFISGDVTIYYEGIYVGDSKINSGKVADTLSFSLGRDRGIIVERKRSTEFSKKSFLAAKRIENVGWEISLRNNKKIDIDLILKDQLPVSMRKEIEVEQNEISGAELDKQSGILQWKIQLKSAESKKFLLKYTVTYPKDKKIIIK